MRIEHIGTPNLVLAPALTACSLIVIYAPDSTPMVVVVASSILTGIGWGGQTPVFWASVRECNKYYDCEDVAVGIANSFGNASGFVSQYLIGLMLDWHWTGTVAEDGSRVYSVADYDFAFISLAVCVVGAFIMSLFVKETYGKPVDYEK